MNRCPEALWEELARADETATFFQTPAWHKLAADFEGTRPRVITLSVGASDALLPLQSRKRWWGETLTAPFGTYATVLRASRENGNNPEITEPAVRRALAGLNALIPGSPFSRDFRDSPRNPVSQTRVLRLETLEPDSWVRSWSRNHRRLFQSAQDHGYTLRPASTTEDISRYHAVYRTQIERWGGATRRVYPEELFQEAFRRFQPEGSMVLWLAESPHEGIVAGRLCLYHGRHAVEWHAAAERNAMNLGVNHCLVHAIVLDARARGFAIYDFNPNPGLPAVDHFKRGFAAEPLTFNGFRQRTLTANAAAILLGPLRR